MREARSGHTATLLADGRVLVTGGSIVHDSATSTAEIYDPAAGTWTLVAPDVDGRVGHTATLLDDGTVLVSGGHLGIARRRPAAPRARASSTLAHGTVVGRRLPCSSVATAHGDAARSTAGSSSRAAARPTARPRRPSCTTRTMAPGSRQRAMTHAGRGRPRRGCRTARCWSSAGTTRAAARPPSASSSS